MKTACVALILALIAAPAAAIEKDIPGTVHDTETNRPCALRTKSVKLWYNRITSADVVCYVDADDSIIRVFYHYTLDCTGKMNIVQVQTRGGALNAYTWERAGTHLYDIISVAICAAPVAVVEKPSE